jgi:cbb3-type cytochrome oxidase cytochrome c subunit
MEAQVYKPVVPVSKQCSCGSGEWKEAQYDGRGIFLTYTCHLCHHEKMSKYRPEILEHYTQADVDEQIEEDE